MITTFLNYMETLALNPERPIKKINNSTKEENIKKLEEKEIIKIGGKLEMINAKPKKQAHIVIETIRKQQECMEKCTYIFDGEKGLTLLRYQGYSQEVCEYNGMKEKILTNLNKIPWGVL